MAFGSSFNGGISGGSGAIADGSVTTAKLADNSVATAKIINANVTTPKIADANVTTAKIADANVTASKLSGAQAGAAPIFGVRAWIFFNGFAGIGIYGSGNVSSITDNGVGDYTVNFTTALPSANYAAIIGTDIFGFNADPTTLRTASAVRITTLGSGFVAADSGYVSLVCVG